MPLGGERARCAFPAARRVRVSAQKLEFAERAPEGPTPGAARLSAQVQAQAPPLEGWARRRPPSGAGNVGKGHQASLQDSPAEKSLLATACLASENRSD